MALETFLVVLAVVGAMAVWAWLYAAIFDFVDEWKAKERLRGFTFMRSTYDDKGRPVLVPDPDAKKAALESGRLPPMAPAPGWMEHPRTTELRQMTQKLWEPHDPRARGLTVEARLPPMAPAGRYGMDHKLPVGPPDGWEKRPARSRG